jgi:rhamnosyltransferase
MAEPVITAVVTAYHPDQRLAAVLDAALVTCADVLVVDNTPKSEESLTDTFTDARVRVLRSGRNGGLAGALNDAVRELPAATDAALLLDQDSTLPDGMIAALAAHLADPSIGAVAPTPVDIADGRSYERFAPTGGGLADRDTVITSGMLVRRSALTAVGGFRDEFFVDWVDNDFCLRLRRKGIRIVQDLNTVLPHSIGDRREHRVGPFTFRVLRYAPWRHYWITRNGVVMIKEHVGGNPKWALMALLYIGRQAVTTALFEPKRSATLPAILRGIRDGLTGRTTLAYLPKGADYREPARAR